MASQRDYLQFILDQLSAVEGISALPMMGEFLLRCRGRIFGGIFDDRLLVKNVPSAVAYLRVAEYATPYPGAKPMLVVDDVDDRAYLAGLVEAMYDELPPPKKK